MSWIKSHLASDYVQDVYFLAGTITDENLNGSYGSGVWLTVCKGGYIIVDMSPEKHEVIATNQE